MNHFVSEIFAEPETWGLRGDPFLWEYLKKYYADIEIPYSIEQFHSEILLTFQEFTGRPLEKGEQYMASEFAKVHAGMSTGQLDGSFWIDKARYAPCFKSSPFSIYAVKPYIETFGLPP